MAGTNIQPYARTVISQGGHHETQLRQTQRQ